MIVIKVLKDILDKIKGYVLLFSPAFPLAPLCAFLNNLLEARVDAFKLCALHRRPWPTDDGGGWDGVIKVIF